MIWSYILEKTDSLLIHLWFCKGTAPLDYLQFRDKQISDKVTSLGIIVNKHLSFDDQIDVFKSLINYLRNLFRIRIYLDVNALSVATHVLKTLDSEDDFFPSFWDISAKVTNNIFFQNNPQPHSQGLSSYRPLRRARRDPGTCWSRVSQNLGDDN